MPNLAKNSIIFFSSEAFSSVLLMAMGLAVARLLPVTDFGKYTSALAYATILAVLVDSGMGMVAARDLARSGESATSPLNELFSWRMAMIVVGCVVSPLIAWATMPSETLRWMAVALTPGVLLASSADFFCWLFKGAQRAWACACLQTSSRTLLVVLSVLAAMSPHPLKTLILAYGISGLLTVIVGGWAVSRSLHKLRLVRLPMSFFRQTLPIIYSLGAVLILSVVFTRVDLLLVARIRGDVDAGLFSAAGKIVDAFRLIPMVAYSVYLPVFSAAHEQPTVLRSQFKVAFDILLMLSVTLALSTSAFALPLFTHVLGTPYVGAVACFKPLVWSCVLMFANILMFSLLYATKDHTTPLIAIGVALTVEMGIDFLFLPGSGVVAAGWARLIAETCNGAILAWGLLRRQLLPSTLLVAHPVLIIGPSIALMFFLKHEPLFFQFVLPWLASMTMAFFLGLGRNSIKELALP